MMPKALSVPVVEERTLRQIPCDAKGFCLFSGLPCMQLVQHQACHFLVRCIQSLGPIQPEKSQSVGAKLRQNLVAQRAG